MKRTLRAFLMGLPLLVSSCAVVGPNYCPPEPALPEKWICDSCDVFPPPCNWWEVLQDSLLNCYVEAAISCNRDIWTAETHVLQARAIRQMTASQRYPQVNMNLSASRTYFSKNGPVFAIDAIDMPDTPGLPFDLHIPQLQNIYTGLLDISWEVDLFGKIRRQIESADAVIGSTIAERDGVLISVIADVVRNYIDLREAQARGVLQESMITLLEKEREVSLQRSSKGLTNQLEFASIEAKLEEAKSLLPPICTEIYQHIYALSLLTGRFPEILLTELCPIQPLPQWPCQISCGLRSDLLRRRPDIRAAERDLAAATANIGVAVASFFPSFSLAGNIGLQSIQLSKFFQGNSLTWSIGGMSIIPIFQGGYLVGNLRLTEAQAMEAAFVYQQNILKALQEVESSLVAYHEEEKRTALLRQTVASYKEVDRLTSERYTRGLVSVSDWLDSQKQVNTSQQDLLHSEGSRLRDLVALYKALGGGWECE